MTNQDRSEMLSEEPQTFSRNEASAYLRERWGLSYAPYTLAAYAVKGKGPEYSRAGPFTVYTREALDTWAQTKLTTPSKKASELKPLTEHGNGKT